MVPLGWAPSDATVQEPETQSRRDWKQLPFAACMRRKRSTARSSASRNPVSRLRAGGNSSSSRCHPLPNPCRARGPYSGSAVSRAWRMRHATPANPSPLKGEGLTAMRSWPISTTTSLSPRGRGTEGEGVAFGGNQSGFHEYKLGFPRSYVNERERRILRK